MPGSRSLNLYFKRHHKAHRMSIQNKPPPPPPPISTRHIGNKPIRRLAYRGGIVKFGKQSYDETRKQLHCFVSKVLDNAIKYVDHCRRKTVMKADIDEALKREGITVYE